jgi:hypothetical protein
VVIGGSSSSPRDGLSNRGCSRYFTRIADRASNLVSKEARQLGDTIWEINWRASSRSLKKVSSFSAAARSPLDKDVSISTQIGILEFNFETLKIFLLRGIIYAFTDSVDHNAVMLPTSIIQHISHQKPSIKSYLIHNKCSASMMFSDYSQGSSVDVIKSQCFLSVCLELASTRRGYGYQSLRL